VGGDNEHTQHTKQELCPKCSVTETDKMADGTTSDLRGCLTPVANCTSPDRYPISGSCVPVVSGDSFTAVAVAGNADQLVWSRWTFNPNVSVSLFPVETLGGVTLEECIFRAENTTGSRADSVQYEQLSSVCSLMTHIKPVGAGEGGGVPGGAKSTVVDGLEIPPLVTCVFERTNPAATDPTAVVSSGLLGPAQEVVLVSKEASFTFTNNFTDRRPLLPTIEVDQAGSACRATLAETQLDPRTQSDLLSAMSAWCVGQPGQEICAEFCANNSTWPAMSSCRAPSETALIVAFVVFGAVAVAVGIAGYLTPAGRWRLMVWLPVALVVLLPLAAWAFIELGLYMDQHGRGGKGDFGGADEANPGPGVYAGAAELTQGCVPPNACSGVEMCGQVDSTASACAWCYPEFLGTDAPGNLAGGYLVQKPSDCPKGSFVSQIAGLCGQSRCKDAGTIWDLGSLQCVSNGWDQYLVGNGCQYAVYNVENLTPLTFNLVWTNIEGYNAGGCADGADCALLPWQMVTLVAKVGSEHGSHYTAAVTEQVSGFVYTCEFITPYSDECGAPQVGVTPDPPVGQFPFPMTAIKATAAFADQRSNAGLVSLRMVNPYNTKES